MKKSNEAKTKKVSRNQGRILRYIANTLPIEEEIGGKIHDYFKTPNEGDLIESIKNNLETNWSQGYIEDIKKECGDINIESIILLIKKEVHYSNTESEDENQIMIGLDSLCLDQYR